MKTYEIPIEKFYEAFRKVKANKGSAGVDRISIEAFDLNLDDNIYKLWNRTSSGSYFPPAVKRVEIPKADGKMRALGIPTVGDWVVQMVVRDMIELRLETIFSNNSYGYRPDKSPIEAVSQAKRMCWEYDFVIDIDIKGFFDNINHELLMKAVEKHVEEKWIKLYIKRWLTAPVELPDGRLEEREKGVPQGGVVSPILSNLFLHYVMDKWLEINYPEIKYERFADDGIIHCRTEKEAEEIKFALEKRFNECELELHPEKTTIAYCKDSNRKQEYPIIAFTFLGFTFKGRRALTKKGKIFTSFLPAMSEKAKKKAGEKIREMNISIMDPWKRTKKIYCIAIKKMLK